MPYADPQKTALYRKQYYLRNSEKIKERSMSRYLSMSPEERSIERRENYRKRRHLLVNGLGHGHGKGKKFQKGQEPWNKGKKCGPAWNKGKKCSESWVKKMSETRKGRTPPNKGKPSLLRGSKHHNWKGGVTPIHEAERKSFRYKEWRAAVFKRDNFRCVQCGCHGYINADHIMPFCRFPELRYEVSNGRTLCVECHKKTPTFGRKAQTADVLVFAPSPHYFTHV